MDTPKTASELNYWLETRFLVFTGPSRAFFDLPMRDGPIERRVYTTHAAIGPEHVCCEAMARMLQLIPAGEALFMRRPFTYEHGMITARLVFWREEALPPLRFVKAEGEPAQRL